jgi:hypothetical protein
MCGMKNWIEAGEKERNSSQANFEQSEVLYIFLLGFLNKTNSQQFNTREEGGSEKGGERE